MTKFAKVVIIVGVLALAPTVAVVRAFVLSQNGYMDNTEVILVTALIYVAAGVVIVAPAWVIKQVLMLVLQHAIVTSKHNRH